MRSRSIRALDASARTSWAQVVLRAAGLFIVTIWLFYFLGFDDRSPVYTESDSKLLLSRSVGWPWGHSFLSCASARGALPGSLALSPASVGTWCWHWPLSFRWGPERPLCR